ncbi:hypothetical protein NP233_g5214 [Leucocoprinus birnbaumii]|uniref:Uncharacterized protein n=1 Tax=Leucocoprinus birnbaumii TaxID=56174 RepID=A0AAD5VZL4_9AGAR|nr:hypothetical protein NP233_g5214 [Leucocoprinus birnbaumii]
MISKGRPGAAASTGTSSINDLNAFTYDTSNITLIWPKLRIASDTSTTTSMSPSSSSSAYSSFRASPPVLSGTSVAPTSTTSQNTGGFRLVPCEIEVADAVVVVIETVPGSGRSRAMLLVGPAAQPYRQPSSRPIMKNSRVHPYKIAPTQNLNHRLSMLSIRSQLG